MARIHPSDITGVSNRTRSKYWVFTTNNPVPSEVPDQFDSPLIHCCVYQFERGENGTLHIQGYIVFSKARSLLQVKAIIGSRAHIDIRRGSAEQAISYCSKQDTRESGPFYLPDESTVRAHSNSGDQGSRVDLAQFRSESEAGNVLYEDRFGRFAAIYSRYPKFYVETQEFYRQRALSISTVVPTQEWQVELTSVLSEMPDRRTIYWYWSQTGNVGKSHYVSSRLDAGTCFACNGGRFADIYLAYSDVGCPREFFIDWPRNKPMEQFPYDVIESLKNGWFLSTKYGSRLVKFAVPHVVVFANHLPADNALSLDRLVIKNLD